MPELVPGSTVQVEVPATSANLGPGFDSFGLALDWRERVTLAVVEHGFDLEVTGEGADSVPRDATHLIIRSVLVGLADLGLSAPGLGLQAHNTIPHGRGLGSSSAAIVAGLVAARALAGLPPDPRWVLGHANAIEGHPDNVAAAAYGGFVLAYAGRDGLRVAQPRVLEQIQTMILVPGRSVATRTARGLLPEVVPHVDAAENSARAALLVHALTAEPGLLLEATRDWLHTEYRRPALGPSYELVAALRGNGVPAVISGAGPSVLVLGEESVLDQVGVPAGFDVHRVGVGRAAGVVRSPTRAGNGTIDGDGC